MSPAVIQTGNDYGTSGITVLLRTPGRGNKA
jgi:hypothetical protein